MWTLIFIIWIDKIKKETDMKEEEEKEKK